MNQVKIKLSQNETLSVESNLDVNKLTIRENSVILDAIKIIEANRIQTVFVVDESKVLKGLVTNGDVRRYLLGGGKTSDCLLNCMNSNYRAVTANTRREELLKLLDLGLSVIPRIDEAGRLCEIITKEYELSTAESRILTRARAPVRMSFAGGGSDLTYYFIDHPGVTLSATLALYCHATLIPRLDEIINIYSEDLNTHDRFNSFNQLVQCDRPKNLLAAVVKIIRPQFGFDLYVRSDFPIGSGLGGSSAVATAVVAAFNEMRLDYWSPYEIAEIAFQGERLCFGVAGGWQDQYASAFGGFNLIEFGDKKNLVHAIKLDQSIINELQECLVLCNSNIRHDSGILHEKQHKAYSAQDKTAEIKAIVELCRDMHRHLLRAELLEFGKSLDKAWKIKRGLSDSITNSAIDNIYDSAISAGASGGKLLGAGAGGFFLFYVQPQYRVAVASKLKDLGCTLASINFDAHGVVSWRQKIL
jgi:D-glycero-alpha-D-manno-heptose-7-phosphate kinase